MSAIKLLIARHGETDYNQKGLLQGRGIDASLNKRGREQAARLAGYLKNYNPDFVACSSLRRTRETAKPLTDELSLSVTESKGLDEMDFGRYEGEPYLEVANQLTELQKTWLSGNLDESIPEGESPRGVFERANSAFLDLTKNYSGDTMVLVLHGRLIRILLSEWLGYGLRNMHKIEHQNGAVYQLVYNGSFKPVYLNKTDHLIDLT
ncbi:MAG: histidine phosphatase family protein [Balneolaceae bacterium]|nr:histidine phosphatase family protein [Balneolaceae bacterium]MCH8549792.1 histidine phosphatase family protein [Balneolaceae bacterium]